MNRFSIHEKLGYLEMNRGNFILGSRIAYLPNFDYINHKNAWAK